MHEKSSFPERVENRYLKCLGMLVFNEHSLDFLSTSCMINILDSRKGTIVKKIFRGKIHALLNKWTVEFRNIWRSIFQTTSNTTQKMRFSLKYFLSTA